MPLVVIKSQRNKGKTGDGGPVDSEGYIKIVLGPPHFAPYLLPQKILITKIIVKSSINQACTIVGTKPDTSTVEIVPLTNYVANQVETFNPFVFSKDQLSIDSPDASAVNDLYVIIMYQLINI